MYGNITQRNVVTLNGKKGPKRVTKKCLRDKKMP